MGAEVGHDSNLGDAFIGSVNAAHRSGTLCQPTVTDRYPHPTHSREWRRSRARRAAACCNPEVGGLIKRKRPARRPRHDSSTSSREFPS